MRQHAESGVLPQKRIRIFCLCSRFDNVMPRQILVRIEPKHFQKRHKLKGIKNFLPKRELQIQTAEISVALRNFQKFKPFFSKKFENAKKNIIAGKIAGQEKSKKCR